MMPQDNQIDIFLFNPTEELLATIDNKELALTRLGELPNSAAKCYFLWQRDSSTNTRIGLIEMCIKDNNFNLFCILFDGKPKEVSDDVIQRIAFLSGQYNRTNVIDYIGIGFLHRHVAHGAALGGHTELVNRMIKDGEIGLTEIASNAAEGCHKEMVKDMIKRGAKYPDYLINSAVKGGNLDIINMVIDCGENDWERIAKLAAQYGNKELLNDMIKRGARNWIEIAHEAAFSGNIVIIKDMIERAHKDGIKIETWNYNYIAMNAAQEGHTEIVNYAIENGTTNWDWIASSAAFNDNIDIVIAMAERGINNHHEILETAYSENSEKTIRFITECIIAKNRKKNCIV